MTVVTKQGLASTELWESIFQGSFPLPHPSTLYSLTSLPTSLFSSVFLLRWLFRQPITLPTQSVTHSIPQFITKSITHSAIPSRTQSKLSFLGPLWNFEPV